MRRSLILLLVLLAPVVATVAGCAQKVTTVQRSERIEESEPKMVSPGQEVIE